MTTTTTEINDAIETYADGRSASESATVASCGDACVKLTGRDAAGRWAFDGYNYCGSRFDRVVATLAADATAEEIEAAAERITEWIEGQ